ncbi:MAG TPA: Do family serine endopeptidase [Myxococcaceae bacterium]|nr:Do family serine endopeptidase [Myxococcaceae bacterium]
MNASLRRLLLVVGGALAVGGASAVLAPSPAAHADQPAAPSPAPAAAVAPQLPSFAPLAESVKGAVVNVQVTAKLPGHRSELFEQFFGGGTGNLPPQIRQGEGSGFIIDRRGYVLTNNHVVDGATSIRVKLDDGRTLDAEVLGRDPPTDVALVKLKNPPANLPVLKLGDSDAMRVGDWVVAIGNPFGLESSVSVGILSAKARNLHAGTYDDFLQTDAAINPGNSGGPLFNLRGEVIGINTAIVSGGAGIGFAVPSNMAKSLLPQLEKNGSVTRGYIGIGLQKLTPELARALGVPTAQGALVTQVQKDTPGARAGLKQDDVVTQIDGQPVTSDDQLRRTVALRAPGAAVTLTLYREGKPREVKVTLTTRPGEEEVSQRGPPNREPRDESSKEQFGLTLETPSPQQARAQGLPRGAWITAVEPGSAADKAGLEPRTLIIEAGGQVVTSAGDLSRILRAAKPGRTILLRAQVGAGDPPPTRLFALEVP